MGNQEEKKVQDEMQEQRAEKKPYKTPEISRLGSVKQLTQSNFGAGPDGLGEAS